MSDFNQPVSGLVTPRVGGIATFMRLPHVPLEDAKDIDIGIVGIPWDGGTTNRPGPRHAPRQMRDASAMVRRMHPTMHIVPYDLANVADKNYRGIGWGVDGPGRNLTIKLRFRF